MMLNDEENPLLTKFDRPLPFCGCGVGWCSLLLGCLCPLIWYAGAALYLWKYYDRDPRERLGLAASTAAAVVFTVVAMTVLIALAVVLHSR